MRVARGRMKGILESGMIRRSRTITTSAGPLKMITGVSSRAKVVWLSLLASMTGVGGVLLMLNPAQAGDRAGMPALVATAPAAGLDAIFSSPAKLDRTRWTSIVIHHSGANFGTPSSIDKEHRAQGSRWMGHHFVIGNGRGMEDGELHVGYRWLQQLPGHHAAGPRGEEFNLRSISICLVGDGDSTPFTPLQLQRLRQLLDGLRREMGISADQVVLHSAIAPTTDPGRLFPQAWLREQLAGSR